MSPIEHLANSIFGNVSSITFSEEALAKIEKHGTSLTSPSHSVKTVEQAVWFSIRTKPPPDQEISDDIIPFIELLEEETDLIAAHWLMYLSKGSKWKLLSYFEQRKNPRHFRIGGFRLKPGMPRPEGWGSHNESDRILWAVRVLWHSENK